MSTRLALLLAATLSMGEAAIAQTIVATPLPPCPKAAEVRHQHLLGLWRAEFEGLARGATLLLEQHPELKDGLRGAINRDGERAQLAGDIEDGALEMEESVNGVNISATWTGDVVDGSCGREIRGSWKAERGSRTHSFILRKQ